MELDIRLITRIKFSRLGGYPQGTREHVVQYQKEGSQMDLTRHRNLRIAGILRKLKKNNLAFKIFLWRKLLGNNRKIAFCGCLTKKLSF